VFELFTRSLPGGRGYGVVAGTGRALTALADFRFGPEELAWLAEEQVVSPLVLSYLEDFAFTGDVWGFPEGELYRADSPILTVEAPLGQALLVETVLLSIFNHDSAIASAAARMVLAAGDRPVIEGGARRAHETAAVAAARAAYLAGAAGTSNLEAGRTWGIPTVGTIGHAFILAHHDEASAFRAQHALLGADTTYLVDTYDIAEGIRTAVSIAGPGLGAIRIDSGDPAVESVRARHLLDELGATGTRIIVSSDLDEWAIVDLQAAPVDGYLVGTRLITGSGHPTASMVYKLVAIEDGGHLRSVRKRSLGKDTIGGRKAAFRTAEGTETLVVDNDVAPDQVPGPGRRLQQQLIRAGTRLVDETIDDARNRCAATLADLPESARTLEPRKAPDHPDG
jgi:nicotinate phosphoribosyltransferase